MHLFFLVGCKQISVLLRTCFHTGKYTKGRLCACKHKDAPWTRFHFVWKVFAFPLNTGNGGNRHRLLMNSAIKLRGAIREFAFQGGSQLIIRPLCSGTTNPYLTSSTSSPIQLSHSLCSQSGRRDRSFFTGRQLCQTAVCLSR